MPYEFIARNGLIAQNNSIITGSLTVTGTITATTLVAQTITSSTSWITGSTKFGSTTSNTHQFTGSIYQSGSEAIFAGSVGIGTTSPFTIGGTAKVSIYGDGPFTFGLTNTDAVYLRRYGTGQYQFQTTANGGNTGDLSLQSYGGNVGIGTTSPGSSLHVAGDITSNPSGNGIHLGYSSNFYGVIQSNGVSGSVIDFSTSGNDYKGRLLYDNSNNYLDISTNNAFAMRINSSGSVGIGTTSPYSKLDVIGTIAINGAAFAANSTTYTQIYKAQSNSIGIYLGGSGDPTNYYDNTTHYFRSSGGGSTYVTINSTGVGIGTTSPSAKLNIFGTQGDGSTTPQETLLYVGGNELGNSGGYAGIRLAGAANTIT